MWCNWCLLLLIVCFYHIVACQGNLAPETGTAGNSIHNARHLSSIANFDTVTDSHFALSITQMDGDDDNDDDDDDGSVEDVAETLSPSLTGDTEVEGDSTTVAPSAASDSDDGNDGDDGGDDDDDGNDNDDDASSNKEEETSTSVPSLSPTTVETLSPTVMSTMFPTISTLSPTVATLSPTVATLSPTVATLSPTIATQSPTRTPTVSPTTRVPTRAPSRAPTRFPTHAPVRLTSRTGAPSTLPTENALLAQLRYPNELSTSISSAFYTFAGCIAFLWAVAGVVYIGRKKGYIQLPADKQAMLAAAKAKSQKNRVKKFEDYWDTGSEMSDDSVSKFPNRAPTASTFDDYWDDNIEFSTHSTDGFNLSRNL